MTCHHKGVVYANRLPLVRTVRTVTVARYQRVAHSSCVLVVVNTGRPKLASEEIKYTQFLYVGMPQKASDENDTLLREQCGFEQTCDGDELPASTK